MPEVIETTAQTAFVSEVSGTKIAVETEEATVTESEDVTEKRDIFTEEKTPTERETVTEDCTEITEEVITEPEEETVECIDEGDQGLAEYKNPSLSSTAWTSLPTSFGVLATISIRSPVPSTQE